MLENDGSSSHPFRKALYISQHLGRMGRFGNQLSWDALNHMQDFQLCLKDPAVLMKAMR